MAGLLSDVLPFLYSQGDRAKRHVRNLLSDPIGSLEQTAGGVQDAHRAQLGLLARAFPDEKQPFKVGDEAALAQATQNMMNGPLGFAPAGITAWHGSPHIFDKFDSSKIGTGEGAQAYGHGLYLAENPEVAKQYAGMNPASSVRIIPNGKQYDVVAVHDSGPLRDVGTFATRAEAEKAAGGYTGANHYKVDLPDDTIAKMLDWDKPVMQQAVGQKFGLTVQKNPEAWGSERYLLNANVGGNPASVNAFRTKREALESLNSVTGGDLYSSMFTPMGVTASQRLREMGIPGIRYLDGGSRGAGKGSSNFVVFPGEEGLLKILERNGVPIGK